MFTGRRRDKEIEELGIIFLALLALIMLFCSGCMKVSGGTDNTATVQGEIKITHQVGITPELDEVFQDQCEAEGGTDEEIKQCIAAKKDKFITDFLRFLEEQQPGGAQ